jgi:hypothetical protein
VPLLPPWSFIDSELPLPPPPKASKVSEALNPDSAILL